jgi:thiamine biosynthesis protein ThiS
MEIIVNGQSQTLDTENTLSDLVKSMDIGNQRFAIEVNQELVPRSTFDSFVLNDGDKVEIVGAIGGG